MAKKLYIRLGDGTPSTLGTALAEAGGVEYQTTREYASAAHTGEFYGFAQTSRELRKVHQTIIRTEGDMFPFTMVRTNNPELTKMLETDGFQVIE